MNERCSGAIEALSWVLNLLERAAVKKLDLASIVVEVEHVHDELLRVAVDFERRVLKHYLLFSFSQSFNIPVRSRQACQGF